MQLSDGLKDRSYIVTSMDLPTDLLHRLEALGMTLKTPVTVLSRKGDGVMIIRLRGSRYALGDNITKNIQVTEGGRRCRGECVTRREEP